MSDGILVGPLAGQLVRLEPLSIDVVEELVEAANEDRSTYVFTWVPLDVTAMRVHVETLLADADTGASVPFVQRALHSRRVVGMTRYLTIRRRLEEATPFAVEIGGTWLAASAQRSGINTEAKFLMLRHAFETWRVVRVDLKTDDRNERSKAAIVRIGALREGVLRKWQPSQVRGEETRYRDSAMFSITSDEWPTVKSRLLTMID